MFLVGLVRDDRHRTVGTGSCPVGAAGIALVANRSPRRDIRSKLKQDGKMRCIRLLATGQIESDRKAFKVGLQVDFRGETAARVSQRLTVLPPFAPAAET